MYRKSLDLNAELGRKEGMASDCGNLGNLYATRGDFDGAEEMHCKSLALFKEVGAKDKIEQAQGLLDALARERNHG
jgi:hypothetical protein